MLFISFFRFFFFYYFCTHRYLHVLTPSFPTRRSSDLPEALIDLYKRAGAKYFMALGCHHDNLDAFDSAHHAWNATRVGPRRDIVGTWEKAEIGRAHV